MIYPVKVYSPKGKLKQTYSTETLNKIFWDKANINIESIRIFTGNFDRKDKKPRIKPSKISAKFCKIWPLLCARPGCNTYAIKLSEGAKYCTKKCRGAENSDERARKNKKLAIKNKLIKERKKN